MGRPSKGGATNYVTAWRKERGLTQADLAEKVGTTASVISLLETGARPLSEHWLRGIADALNTTPGALLQFGPNSDLGRLTVMLKDVSEDSYPQVEEMLKIFRRR